MGNCLKPTNSRAAKSPFFGDVGSKDQEVKPTQFKPLHAIGKGGYGKVWKVVHTASGKHYAMKKMQKVRIVCRESLADILAE